MPEAARGREDERRVVILVHRAEAEEVFPRDFQRHARALDEKAQRRLLLDALEKVVRDARHQATVLAVFRGGSSRGICM